MLVVVFSTTAAAVAGAVLAVLAWVWFASPGLRAVRGLDDQTAPGQPLEPK